MDSSPEPAHLRADAVPGAVLVDLENLVFGLAHHYGSEHVHEAVCLSTLCRVLRELVHPGLRRAFGDWRLRDLNQFQVELYRSGFEIVQVLGRPAPGSRKNSSDIRLAVDAVELALREPHLRRFVIVSGDRDMIEVVRCLQKHGREVVVIAPDGSASADLADTCDRFVPYSSVQRRAGLVLPVRTSTAPPAEPVPAGALGAPDESAHETTRPAQVHPAQARLATAPGLPGQDQLAARARLGNYRYEGDPGRRRRLLRALHDAARARTEFSLAEVRTVLSAPDSGLAARPADVNKVWTVLYQGRAFRPTDHDSVTPMQFRRHALAPEARDAEQLVRIYERCIVYKLMENSRIPPTAQEVRVLLGLQEEDLAWCTGLLEEARRLLQPT